MKIEVTESAVQACGLDASRARELAAHVRAVVANESPGMQVAALLAAMLDLGRDIGLSKHDMADIICVEPARTAEGRPC